MSSRPTTPDRHAVLVVRYGETVNVIYVDEGKRVLEPVHCGLIASTTEDLRSCLRPTNVRKESLTGPHFQAAFEYRRRVIAMDGFKFHGKVGRERLPFRISRIDRQPFLLAGIWEIWREPETKPTVKTVALITVLANAMVARRNDRMGAIIEKPSVSAWLDHSRFDSEALLALLHPYSGQAFELYRTSLPAEEPPVLKRPPEPGLFS